MTLLAELLNALIEDLGWILSITGFGIVIVGMLYLWGKRNKRLALVILGSLMLVLGQIVIALHQGGWRLALLSGLIFGTIALIAIFRQAMQLFVIEPRADEAFLRPRGPLSIWINDWLRKPGNKSLKRFLFPRIIDRLDEFDR